MAMYYISQLLNLPVRDRSGERIATVTDLISRFGSYYPTITGFQARARRRKFFLPWSQVAQVTDQAVNLSTFKLDFQPFARRAGEILLARDLLDKQIIDINGQRVVRVNDVQLATMRQILRVVGVDVSFQGLLRRLLPKNLIKSMLKEGKLPDVIDWANVEYLTTEAPAVKLNVSHGRIAKLHPVEIAKLVEALSYKHEAEIMGALDPHKAADALEEMSTERQADIINRMTEDKAAEILDHMGPDEAADLLGEISEEISEEKAEELLERMSPEESEEVRELLAYEENTAGGIMTTDFVHLSAQLTVAAAIEQLRALPDKPDMIYDIYLVESEEDLHLQGVVSLRDLILAEHDAQLETVMRKPLASVEPATEAVQVAQKIAEYNLLSIPVLDEQNNILGIVTVDDAIALLLPKK